MRQLQVGLLRVPILLTTTPTRCWVLPEVSFSGRGPWGLVAGDADSDIGLPGATVNGALAAPESARRTPAARETHSSRVIDKLPSPKLRGRQELRYQIVCLMLHPDGKVYRTFFVFGRPLLRYSGGQGIGMCYQRSAVRARRLPSASVLNSQKSSLGGDWQAALPHSGGHSLPHPTARNTR